MKWLQLFCGFRKSRDRRARNRLSGGTDVAASEVTLEDRVLLSAVPPAAGLPSPDAADEAATVISNDSGEAAPSDANSPYQYGVTTTVVADSASANSLSQSDGALFQEYPADSSNADFAVEVATDYHATPAASDREVYAPDLRGGTSDLNGLPDSIGEPKSALRPVAPPSRDANLANDEKPADESASEVSGDVAVRAAKTRHLGSLTPTSQRFPEETSSETTFHVSDDTGSQSSSVQRKTHFGRAYLIVPRQNHTASVSRSINAVSDSVGNPGPTESDVSPHLWQPVSALLGGDLRFQEVDSAKAASFRVTNWLTGQSNPHHRMALVESSMVMAAQREFAEAGVEHSQRSTQESQTDMLARIESELIGFTSEVDADDNPPERPEVLGVWQYLEFDCNPRGPPGNDRIPISGFNRRTGGADQLFQLRFSIAPRGPSVAFRS